MTFLQSPIPLKRRFDRDASAGQPDNASASDPDLTPVSELEPGAPVEADVDQVVVAPGNPTPLRLFGLAALSGAVAGAVVALAIALLPLRATDDPRTQQLTHDLGDLTARVDTITDKARTLENEGVAASQTVGAIDTRLASATGEIDAVRAALSALTAEQQLSKDSQAGVNAPALFGVAVIQMRERIETGLAFDWELVNLRGIVGTDPALLAELDRLAPMSATGVVTQQRLVEAMQALVGRESSGSSLVQAGIGVVSRMLGPAVTGSSGSDAQILSRGMARLAAGDLSNFVREMQGLSATAAGDARPLVVAAQRRLVALNAVQTLLRAAKASLQTQLKSVAATTTVVSPQP